MALQASVIVPTFEDWDRMQTCLDSLAAQSVGQDRFEVIVANNNTDPAVPPDLRLPGNARVLHVPQPGSYAARNAAIRAARGDVLFFTDCDCLPDTRWIEAGLAAIAPLGPHDRVGGRVEFFFPDNRWTAPALFDRSFSLPQEKYVERGYAVTANLVTRRAAFDLVGFFDDERFSAGDVAWGKAATAKGTRIIFSPETLVRHPARSSFAELAKRRRRLTGGKFQNETQGITARRSILGHLNNQILNSFRGASLAEGLTFAERLVVLWIGLRLCRVEIMELIRLRYFAGMPQRS